ncbi:MAG: adenine phosphoribosyltransferase, partial [Candidatus Omnitrophica bacterium]|nr:adenine phosphoribosyltransferase [Candidatus Omnitrophota bacterium]
LPLASHREAYGLEYGNDSLEIQQSTLPKDAKVLLLDDVLATGGTLLAADKLIRSAGFEVAGAITLLEITFLNGDQLLEQNGIRHQSVLKS